MHAATAQPNEWNQLIYQAYARTFDDERHLNSLQNTMRGFASAWLLATFSAIGYLLLHHGDDNWMCPPHLVLAMLPLMGATGIFVLCVLDQIVYRRLLSGVILTGLQMEFFSPFLPPVRATCMLIATTAKDIGHTKGFHWFYLAPLLILLLIATLSSLLFLDDLSTPSIRPTPIVLFRAIGFMTLTAPWAGFFYLRHQLTAHDPNKNHKHLITAPLKKILDDKDFAQIVHRYERAQHHSLYPPDTDASGH